MKQRFFLPVISVITACMILLCQGSTVSAETRSQINVLPNTNTNIFDEEMLALLSEITEAAAQSQNVSIYYHDTETGYYFYYNPDSVYNSASTIKAIYCQYIVQSGADLSRKVEFTYAEKESYSGKLTANAVGQYFTVDELIQYSLIYSDNMAYRLLFRTFGNEGFNTYIKSLGLSRPQLSSYSEYTTVTAKDMDKCMLEIYRYSEAENAPYIIELLKNTTYNVQLSKGTKYETAHKYGYQGGSNGFHDTAIIYADEPYILSVYTNVNGNDKDCYKIFVQLSELTEKLHDKLHPTKKKSSELLRIFFPFLDKYAELFS
ncbi:MAG: class A beta-lactamase-related serine hydrolase [Oscillospiraceae bacterium]|nr:class A beta-lactamase-related serine hydrolase [Oscillospiraceae bacterium]